MIKTIFLLLQVAVLNTTTLGQIATIKNNAQPVGKFMLERDN